ncbi:hypothetical protein PC129_g25494 [Phytophthora cactorum]|uniref:Uncharacterized protein n=1 Tax=Phytophthora cactorum TaxID=29920 RepID=A0A8T1GP42_9STRA|nr:hypothetical protein PC129_g25494 [Phytophthora cactorum]
MVWKYSSREVLALVGSTLTTDRMGNTRSLTISEAAERCVVALSDPTLHGVSELARLPCSLGGTAERDLLGRPVVVSTKERSIPGGTRWSLGSDEGSGEGSADGCGRVTGS